MTTQTTSNILYFGRRIACVRGYNELLYCNFLQVFGAWITDETEMRWTVFKSGLTPSNHQEKRSSAILSSLLLFVQSDNGIPIYRTYKGSENRWIREIGEKKKIGARNREFHCSYVIAILIPGPAVIDCSCCGVHRCQSFFFLLPLNYHEFNFYVVFFALFVYWFRPLLAKLIK